MPAGWRAQHLLWTPNRAIRLAPLHSCLPPPVIALECCPLANVWNGLTESACRHTVVEQTSTPTRAQASCLSKRIGGGRERVSTLGLLSHLGRNLIAYGRVSSASAVSW